jgi:hypothetical protein
MLSFSFLTLGEIATVVEKVHEIKRNEDLRTRNISRVDLAAVENRTEIFLKETRIFVPQSFHLRHILS